ncbi:MAG: IclR family transcriptional regulator [Acidobacteria bacterium]|nr:IclR family transcriptional regulator [Acidobacteriota bacterium]
MSATKEGPSKAVERALSILEGISHRAGGMTNSEISRRLGIPKSSASYILRTLERRGYLRRERGSGKYRVGLKVLSLGRGVLVGLGIREAALPMLRQLVERSHLAGHLAILDRGEAVYIEKVEGPGFIKMDTWVGRRMEVHSTSVGKALVAHLPEAEVEAIIRERGLKKRTPKTITDRCKFLRELETVRAHGYAVDDQENSVGVRCVAAPVFDSLGKVEASVGVSGITSQVDKAHLPKIAELVKETARRISHQLGYEIPSRRS